jgi:hypothetical protein
MLSGNNCIISGTLPRFVNGEINIPKPDLWVDRNIGDSFKDEFKPCFFNNTFFHFLNSSLKELLDDDKKLDHFVTFSYNLLQKGGGRNECYTHNNQ